MGNFLLACLITRGYISCLAALRSHHLLKGCLDARIIDLTWDFAVSIKKTCEEMWRDGIRTENMVNNFLDLRTCLGSNAGTYMDTINRHAGYKLNPSEYHGDGIWNRQPCAEHMINMMSLYVIHNSWFWKVLLDTRQCPDDFNPSPSSYCIWHSGKYYNNQLITIIYHDN